MLSVFDLNFYMHTGSFYTDTQARGMLTLTPALLLTRVFASIRFVNNRFIRGPFIIHTCMCTNASGRSPAAIPSLRRLFGLSTHLPIEQVLGGLLAHDGHVVGAARVSEVAHAAHVLVGAVLEPGPGVLMCTWCGWLIENLLVACL